MVGKNYFEPCLFDWKLALHCPALIGVSVQIQAILRAAQGRRAKHPRRHDFDIGSIIAPINRHHLNPIAIRALATHGHHRLFCNPCVVADNHYADHITHTVTGHAR